MVLVNQREFTESRGKYINMLCGKLFLVRQGKRYLRLPPSFNLLAPEFSLKF